MMLPIEQFALKGAVQSCERYGNGHINETYLVTCPSARYILQKINTNVFKKPDELMQNIESVLRHQRSRVDDPRGCMTLVPTRDGASWYQDESGAYRCYDFVEGSICLDRAESEADFAESGAGFGAFQRMLADFPAHTLHETIPHFHDTPDRYRIFKEAVAADALGRAREVQREIDFALAHEKDAAALMEAGAQMESINRVMFDCKSRARVELERLALDSMTFYFQGRCAIMIITNDMLETSRAAENDMEGLAPLPRQIEGVWVGITLRQKADGNFKVSVRTGSHADASAICAVLGGGGHKQAAGCAVNGPADSAVEKLMDAVRTAVPSIDCA